MNNYLCLTGISQIWDLEKRLVILGPWCLTTRSNQDLLKNKNYILASMPWSSPSKIKEASNYCQKIYERLIPRLSEILNSIHGVAYEERYWRIIIGYWFFHFISVFYDRYKRLELVFSEFPDCYTQIFPINRCSIHSLDTNDFFENQLNDDLYNLKLFSLIVGEFYPQNKKELDCDLGYTVHGKRIIKDSWKGQLFGKFLRAVSSFSKSPIVLSEMYHLKPEDILFIKLKTPLHLLGFINFDYINDPSLMKHYSHKLRAKITINGGEDKFEVLLNKILPKAIPLCYLENYKLYKEHSIDYLDKIKAVGSAVAWYFNERFKFFAVEAALKGARLIEFQHGGGYGTALICSTETLEQEKNLFYTWGWGSEKNDKLKPLPSPHFSKLKDTHSFKYDKIIFIGTGTLKYLYRFYSQISVDNMKKYFTDKIIFLEGLSPDIRKKILYRPYPHEYGWNEGGFIKETYPQVNFLLSKNLVQWMQRVKLVVIDHASTSCLEALTINVPCVFYWDHEVHLIRPEAEVFFELLRKVGILYKDPLSAAKKVNEIFGNPRDWWLSEEVQNARFKFCQRYAYARKDWMNIWAKEFKQLNL